MSNYLGDFKLGQTVRMYFTTHEAGGGRVDPLSAFEAADIRVYKDDDTTEHTTGALDNLVTTFDSLVGLHYVSVDTSDTTDAGFFAVATDYVVVLYPDETVDDEVVVRVLGMFSIENRFNEVDLTKIHGTGLTETAGQLAGAFTKFFDVASPTGTTNSLPDAIPDAAGGLPISDAGGLDLDTLLGTLTSLAAETRSANLLDQIKTVIAVIESQRGTHTHQPSTGSVLFIDGTNGATTGSGATGGISDPISTYLDAETAYGTDFGHDLYIFVAGDGTGVTTHTEAIVPSLGYSLLRGPGRGLIATRAGSGPTFDVTGDGVEISGMQIASPGVAATSSGIDITDTDFVRIHDCWILDTQGDGIHITRGINCQIHNNHFDNTGIAASAQGIHVSGTGPGIASDNRIERNHLSNTGGTAILIEDGTTNDTVITNNQIHNAGAWAIEIGASSTDAFVHDNDFGNNVSGDIQDGGATSIILNNYDVVDGISDEPFTAATHNVPTSFARRLRQLSSHILGPFTVTSATANTISLDADGALSEVDGSFDPSRIFVDSGTGANQTGTVMEYFGTAGNGNPARTLILREDMKVPLNATSSILIIISDGRASTNQGQLRGGSTTSATLNALAPGADVAGQTLHFTSGTGQDQTALVASYSDPIATFSALDVAVNATTGYELLPTGCANLEHIQNDAQSVTDLKDFVDTGYDPVAHKVQGVVLVDTTTTNTDRFIRKTTVQATIGGGNDKFSLAEGSTVDNTYKDHLVVLRDVSNGNMESIGRCTVYTGAGRQMTLDSSVDFTVVTGDIVEIEGMRGTDDAATEAKQDGLIATVGVAGAGLTDLGGMSTGMKGEVESEANDALVALNLDHLMKVVVANNADMTTEVPDGTVLSNLMSSSSDTSTFTVADDSLQGISEGAAGGGASAQEVWEYVTRTLTSGGVSIVLETTTLEAAPRLAIELDQNYAWSKEITVEDSQTGKDHVFAVYNRNDLTTALWELDTSHITVSGDEGKTLTVADDDENTGDAGELYYELANTTDDILVVAGPLTIKPRGDTEA